MLFPQLPRSLADLKDDIFHSSSVASLPNRVRLTLLDKENTSEILVRLIQLFIVVLLGALYFISPKIAVDPHFRPVPQFLAVYLCVTLIGLVWSARRSLPDWAIYLSICFDFALLYGLIWSFHVQYMQPPAFMLKVPTLLYVFMFIALRALRFRARFVLAAGLVAALGWLCVIGYVINANMEAITRDFTVYLTSNSILLGAEFDKIVSILIVTAVLAIAIRRANTFFVSAITETSDAEQLSRFFDQTVVEGIRAQDTIKAGDGVRREAAILTVDIRGFSKLAEQISPDEVVAILAAYQQRVIPIIKKQGGSIDKFMGDGIMASFGAVETTDDYAKNALQAAQEIADAFSVMTAGDPPLSLVQQCGIGIAVSAGTVIYGAVGGPDRLELTVIGAPVNLAAKLEKLNKELGSLLIVSRAALDLALDQGYQPTAPIDARRSAVSGIDAEVDLAVLR